jgi:hypothetical protein
MEIQPGYPAKRNYRSGRNKALAPVNSGTDSATIL